MHIRFLRTSFWCLCLGSTFFNLNSAFSESTPPSELRWTAYRLASDIGVELNGPQDWLAAENHGARISFDEPFRLRIELEMATEIPTALGLQFRYRSDEPWQPIGFSDFPYPKFTTPLISIVSSSSYQHGEETDDLLQTSQWEHEEGIGLSGVSITPLFKLDRASIEWTWALVIRRFADGPRFIEDETELELRVVDHFGHPLSGSAPIRLTGYAPEGHLGGTFVETPAKIGPYQSKSGKLYFIMEPTETDNRFMVVASDDYGKSWREIDGANRPSVGDLEGVGSAWIDGTIHMIHQTSDAVFHHAFTTEDAPDKQDQWTIDSLTIAEPSEPPTQVAAVTARSDEALLAAYGSETGGWLQARTQDGTWATPKALFENKTTQGLSGFQLETDSKGASYLVYTAADGTGWLQIIDKSGELSKPIQVDRKLGTLEEERGAFLPVIALENGGAVIIYRRADGSLWERTFADQTLQAPILITEGPVVSGIVDSDQVGADAILDHETRHVLFIHSDDQDLYHSVRSETAEFWSEPQPVIRGIDAAWVRGARLSDASGKPIYGFVYDAGSKGGAGMNRFHAIPLRDEDSKP